MGLLANVPVDMVGGDVVTSARFNAIHAQQRESLDVKTKTANYVATDSDFIILCDDSGASVGITLPPATDKGKQFLVVRKTAVTNTVTIIAAGADTIEGGSPITLAAQNDKALLVADGVSNWYRIV